MSRKAADLGKPPTFICDHAQGHSCGGCERALPHPHPPQSDSGMGPCYWGVTDEDVRCVPVKK